MKEELRSAAKKNRDKIIDPNKGLQLRDNFIKNIELPAGAIIAAYWPIGSEIDVKPLIRKLYEDGYTVCLPCTAGDGEPLIFREWNPEAVMVKSKGNFRMFEPCHQHHEELIPDIIIAPLLAFDQNLHRLGYGGGYYDRTIKKLRANGNVLAIGVGYTLQEIDKIPAEDWDVQLDKIITETKAY